MSEAENSPASVRIHDIVFLYTGKDANPRAVAVKYSNSPLQEYHPIKGTVTQENLSLGSCKRF